MIIEYHRPENLQETLRLLARPNGLTIPLGGGTSLSQGEKADVAVVDLQKIPLNYIHVEGKTIRIGATTTLADLAMSSDLPAELRRALQKDATGNLRNMATLAGTLVSATGHSHLGVALLALDAHLHILPEIGEITLGDWFLKRAILARNCLIEEISFSSNAALLFDFVSKSPADRAIISVAIAQWTSGRTRITLGGWGSAPILAFDGLDAGGSEIAVENAASQANDAFASGEYRSRAAKIITMRLLG